MELLIIENDQAYLGIPASDVKEVVRAARLAPSSSANESVHGVLNLRGAVVPVIAMRKLLGYSKREIATNDHFVILRHESQLFAIHVDRAIDMLQLPDTNSWDLNGELTHSFAHEEFGIIQCCTAGSLWDRARLGVRPSYNQIEPDSATSDPGQPNVERVVP